ncbi:LOG family protein [Falsiroseomonas ponticola]|uniref:LOG family protein n=1 Tax=Falsiroseomonas ponticola TaxID=2786951 RepID=UPI001933C86D|nr:TIGR00730 family Rossman fold protein [Roseomonas ponticola]
MSSAANFKRICVFCGSAPGVRPAYAEAARELGRVVAKRGLGLVYGGGAVGLMGIAADAALQAGAEVIGVIPHGLLKREVGHGGGVEMHVVDTMHERKAMMADLSDGFIVLPGGFGTLEEAVEALTWAQLGIQAKGVVFLDVEGFWQPFLKTLDFMQVEGFVRPGQRPLAMQAATVEEAIDKLAAFRPPPEVLPWLRPHQA